MEYLIFLILILIIVCIYLYFDKKLANTKRQLLITSNQLLNLKKQTANSLSKYNNLNIKYIFPQFKTAITNKNAILFLSPLINSPRLNILSIKMEVKILDSAIVDNLTWFYVDLPIDSDINRRGWIRKTDFSTIDNNQINISYKKN